MGSSKALLLIHRNMGQVNVSHRVNIMLTPQFYTMKKEDLPLRYHYQAKRIAPSLFDGMLDSEGEYDYFVYKEENMWVFIAYNTEEIKNFLVSKGINSAQVSKMFFAQQAYTLFRKPVYLGEKEALFTLEEDHSVVIVPQSVLGETSHSQLFNNSFTPNKGVSLEGEGSSLLNKKQTYVLATLFLLFSGIFFMEGSRYATDTEMQEKLQLLLDKNPSLQSQYTRESVSAKYRAIDKQERQKRNVVKTLAHLIFKGVTLKTLILTDKKYKAEFICINDKVSQKLQDLAKNENMKSTKVNETTMVLEGEL